MKRFAVFASLIATIPALAQHHPCLVAEVYCHLTVREVDAITGMPVANPSGIIEPGQAALVELSFSYWPPVGEPLMPPYVMHALRGGLDPVVVRALQESGTWLNGHLKQGWDGSTGLPSGPSAQQEVYIFAFQHAEGADQSNPVEAVWQAMWIPDDFTARTVRMRADPWGFDPCMILTVWGRDAGQPSHFQIDPSRPHGTHLDILVGPGPCYANCDNSTTEPLLTVDDFICFINEFATGITLPYEQQIEHYANCDGSTSPPVLNVDDFTCFVNEFAQGCP